MSTTTDTINMDTLYWISGTFGIVAIIAAIYTSILLCRTILKNRKQTMPLNLLREKEQIVFVANSTADYYKEWSTYHVRAFGNKSLHIHSNRHNINKETVTSFEKTEDYSFVVCDN